jgi:hypothetical protein
MAVTQDVYRAWLAAQIERAADAQKLFLISGDAQSPQCPLWVAFQTALSEEFRMRREYWDTFGVPYDAEVTA